MIRKEVTSRDAKVEILLTAIWLCLLYTSDAADE